MKIRVRKDKEDKGEFRGLLLSFLLFLAAAGRMLPCRVRLPFKEDDCWGGGS